MLKKLQFLFAVTIFISGYPLHAAEFAWVNALKSPAWVQRGATKTALKPYSELKSGDRIITDASGRVEIQLPATATLKINENANIGFHSDSSSTPAISAVPPSLVVYHGATCIYYAPEIDTGAKLKLSIDKILLAEMRHRGHFCVFREAGNSSVSLREGSLQITLLVDPGMIIVSVPGTEFRIDDGGEYQLLNAESDAAIRTYNETPVITNVALKPSAATATPPPVATQKTSIDKTEQAKPGANREQITASLPPLPADTTKVDIEQSRTLQSVDNSATSAPSTIPQPAPAAQVDTSQSAALQPVDNSATNTPSTIPPPATAAQVGTSQSAAQPVDNSATNAPSTTPQPATAAQVDTSRNATLQPLDNSATNAPSTTPQPVPTTQAAIDDNPGPIAIANPDEVTPSATSESIAIKAAASDSAVLADKNEDLAQVAAVTSPRGETIEASDYIYTVYLFSSRDRGVADQVNNNLRQAGYKTLILLPNEGATIRYRVGVSDFKTYQAAAKFASEIVGSHGIADTWVGKTAKGTHIYPAPPANSLQ